MKCLSLVFILLFFPLVSHATTKSGSEIISTVFSGDGSTKIGKINNLNTISSREDGNLQLFLLDKGVEHGKVEEGGFWYLSCQSLLDDKNLNRVTCGAQRGEFLVLLTSSGWLIQMENNPGPDGIYHIAFDKEESFSSTFRIMEQQKVKSFLKQLSSASKMQYSTLNKNKKYIRREMYFENTNLALSLLKDMRDYY